MKNINNGKKYSVRKKKIFRFLLSAVLFIVLLFASMLEYLTLTEFKPASSDRLAVDHGNWELLSKGETLKVLTWNCGYGARQCGFLHGWRQRGHDCRPGESAEQS